MIPLILADRIPALDDWGTPESLGAETLEGPIGVSGKLIFGSFETATSGGYYAATRGRYRLEYPFHEHATLIEGELEILDERTGLGAVYGPGDSWIIAKGTPVTWQIRSDRIAKTYLATTQD